MENPNGIYVGNLSFFTTEESLGEFLGDCGTITRLFLPRDSDGKNKGRVEPLLSVSPLSLFSLSLFLFCWKGLLLLLDPLGK